MAHLLKVISSMSRRSLSLTRRYCGRKSPLYYSEEVLQAKCEGRPIVALESTIITHGMPHPHNLETALQVENIIRERGAVPATVAILKGKLTVGLSTAQLEYLSEAKGVVKASRRDMAAVMANGQDGTTTVAGTIIAAELAEIPIFVTGGIGGVHRGGEETLDVSADLNELGRSKTLVVCGGAKSILDIRRTLEYLETQGVCVCAFGTEEFPAFYTVRSGHRAPHHVANALEAARLLRASSELSLNSGIVIAVPVPQQYAMDEAVIEDAIKKALHESERKGIHGKEVTPFILAAVSKVTGGSSLATNIALIKNNAQVGADIAVHYWQMNKSDDHSKTNSQSYQVNLSSDQRREFHTSASSRLKKEDKRVAVFGPHRKSDASILVIGGSNIDRTYTLKENQVQLDGSTHACVTEQSGGGVGRNIAEALWRLRDRRVKLLTAVGDDSDGRYLTSIATGLVLDGCVQQGRTATYAAVLDSRGECVLGLGDMGLHDHITKDLVDQQMEELKRAPLVVLDGNVPQATVDHVLRLCDQMGTPVFFEPTDRRKAVKALNSGKRVSYSSPNRSELLAMATYLQPNLDVKNGNELDVIIKLCEIVSRVVDFLIITLGSKGVVTVSNATDGPEVKLYPVQRVDVVNVSGAGDCFASGFIHGVLSGHEESECVSMGYECAKQALASKHTVPPNLKIGSFTTVNHTYIRTFKLKN